MEREHDVPDPPDLIDLSALAETLAGLSQQTADAVMAKSLRHRLTLEAATERAAIIKKSMDRLASDLASIASNH